MERDRLLTVVRSLTHTVMGAVAPARLADFEADFAQFALTAGLPHAAEQPVSLRREDGLSNTLVAGMFFRVLVEAQELPASPLERQAFVQRRAKNYLVNHLAGQITLSQFYRLLDLIEAKVGDYFSSRSGGLVLSPPLQEVPLAAPLLAEPQLQTRLRQALSRLDLPQKGRRKLTPETLLEFLWRTQGGWFRLLDFESAFRLNKKTAWTYLNLLLQANVLAHNGEKANRVRYALAPDFQPPPACPEASLS